jgi:hypothetical protein
VAVFDEKPEPETDIAIDAEGKRLRITVPENCRVETLRKELLKKLKGMLDMAQDVSMMHGVKRLEDSKPISSYRIGRSSAISVTICLRGGGGRALDTSDSKSILLGLVEIQSPDGSWADPAKVCSIWQSAAKVQVYDELGHLKLPKRERVFATILAIAVLRDQCRDEHQSWKLIERKSFAWLSRFDLNHEELITRAMKVISG